jgi:hypothetical protein
MASVRVRFRPGLLSGEDFPQRIFCSSGVRIWMIYFMLLQYTKWCSADLYYTAGFGGFVLCYYNTPSGALRICRTLPEQTTD